MRSRVLFEVWLSGATVVLMATVTLMCGHKVRCGRTLAHPHAAIPLRARPLNGTLPCLNTATIHTVNTFGVAITTYGRVTFEVWTRGHTAALTLQSYGPALF